MSGPMDGLPDHLLYRDPIRLRDEWKSTDDLLRVLQVEAFEPSTSTRWAMMAAVADLWPTDDGGMIYVIESAYVASEPDSETAAGVLRRPPRCQGDPAFLTMSFELDGFRYEMKGRVEAQMRVVNAGGRLFELSAAFLIQSDWVASVIEEAVR